MKLCLTNLLVLIIPFLSYGQTSIEIKFKWKPAESDTQRFDKAVMRFESDTTTYYLQFDTGATHSYLYSNRLDLEYPDDKVLKTSIGQIKFRNNKSIKATDEKNASIGTLGADFLQGKIVQINFVDETIRIGASYHPTDFIIEPLRTLNGRPVLKLNINGKKQKLLYDTGSSLFGIWTKKNNWKKLREKSDPIKSFPISSWGKINKGFYSSFDKAIPQIWNDSTDDADLQIWYVDNRNYRRFFRKNDLFGILGNQLFLNKEIVMDYSEGLFGIRTVCNNI